MAKSRFHILLEQDIQTLINTRSDELALGYFNTLEQARERVGYIQALRDVIKLANAIEGEQDGSRNAA